MGVSGQRHVPAVLNLR